MLVISLFRSWSLMGVQRRLKSQIGRNQKKFKSPVIRLIGQCGLVTFLLISSSSAWICLVLWSCWCLRKRFLVVSNSDSCTRSSRSMTANLQTAERQRDRVTPLVSHRPVTVMNCLCSVTLPSAGSVFPLPAREASYAAPLPSAAAPAFTITLKV